jgi:hypothetical protein
MKVHVIRRSGPELQAETRLAERWTINCNPDDYCLVLAIQKGKG